MKKLLLLISILFFSKLMMAQVLFYEDFDNVPGPTAGGAGTYSFPAGWFLRNVDNNTPDAQVSYINDAWERREDFGTNVIDSVAFSTSYYAPGGISNDWMWTPLIGPIPVNTVLSWEARSYDPAYKDGYEVRIMLAPNVPGGGTGVIGNQITASTVIFSIAEENTTSTLRSVNLSAYVGQSVYIGFRNISNDKFILTIDDVKLEVQNIFDARLTSIDTINKYTQIPIDHVQPLKLSGNILNGGLDTITAKLNVDIYNNNQLVHNASSDSMLIIPGASSKLNIQNYTPSSPGNYMLKFYSSITENDNDTSNDTLIKYIIITDSVYARDNGQVNGQIGIGAGAGYIGQSFQLYKSDYITSITGSFTKGYSAEKLAAVVWDFSNNLPNQIVAKTDTIFYTDDSARTYTLSIQGGFKLLDSGMYAITFIEFDSTLSLSLTSEYFSPNTTWVYWNNIPGNTWRNFEYFGQNFLKACAIRPNFAELPCNLSLEIDTIFNASCYGKSDGEVYLNVLNQYGNLDYVWLPNVSDTSFATGIAAGTYTITVTDALNCSQNITINILEPTMIDTSIVLMNDTLFAIANSTNYQWIDCSNNSIIANQTLNYFVPSENGSYAVIIGDEFCNDTSQCINYTLSSIITKTNSSIKIFPNPNNGKFIIKSDYKNTHCRIYNSLGVLLKEFDLSVENSFNVEIDDLSSGLYIINSKLNGKDYSEKIVVK